MSGPDRSWVDKLDGWLERNEGNVFLKLRMVYATVVIRSKTYHAYTAINISSTEWEIPALVICWFISSPFFLPRLLRFREEDKENIFG